MSLFAALFSVLMFSYGGMTLGVLPDQDTSPRPAYAAPATLNKLYLPLILKNAVTTNPLWRFGVAQFRRPFTDYVPTDIAAMRFGWYVDFSATSNAPQPYGIQYVPTIRVKQLKLQGTTPTSAPCPASVCPNYVTPYTYTVSPSLSQIASMASARPGTLWLVGNEIERRDWDNGDGTYGGQDEILPELYAVAYHAIYYAIKNADPTALVAIGAVIEATPLRLKYLTQVWNGYSQRYTQTMPVDVWNVHAYVLQEQANSYGANIPAGLTETSGMLYSIPDNVDFTKVSQQINALRTWMRQLSPSQQDKPLIITESGVLYSEYLCYPPYSYCSPGTFTPTNVYNRMMNPAFNYFLATGISSTIGYPADGNRLVQRWNWYSLDDDRTDNNGNQNFNGNLFYSGLGPNPQGIAPLGTYWKSYVQPLPPGSNPPYP